MRPIPTTTAILLALFVMSSSADSAAVTKLNDAITAAKNGDTAQALTLLNGVISSGDLSGEDLAVAYYDRGMIYRSQNDNVKALADADMAIKLNPKYAEAFFNRGLAKRNRGDTEGSETDIAQAKELQPGIGATQ